MFPVFRKELSSFFSSLVGYVAVGVFLIACWLFLWVLPDSSIPAGGYASLDRLFDLAPFLLLLLVPAVTMRLLADEYRGGTIEWLSTKPLRTWDIILGKYLAALVLVLFALIPTAVYIISVHALAEVRSADAARVSLDWGGMAGSYIGLLFLAGTFAAVGLFCSALTSNQVVAFLIALFMCYVLYAGFGALAALRAFAGGVDYYLGLLGLSAHYTSISRGVVDTRDVVYFASVILLFLALTRAVVARRTGG